MSKVEETLIDIEANEFMKRIGVNSNDSVDIRLLKIMKYALRLERRIMDLEKVKNHE